MQQIVTPPMKVYAQPVEEKQYAPVCCPPPNGDDTDNNLRNNNKKTFDYNTSPSVITRKNALAVLNNRLNTYFALKNYTDVKNYNENNNCYN